MLTGMTDEDWEITLKVFRGCRSRRGAKGRNDRSFLEALHYFSVHNVTWRALPAEFGKWNSVWKRFWRLSRAGVFEAFFLRRSQASAGPLTWCRCSTRLSCGHTSRQRVPRGAERSGSGPLTRRVLDQDPPQDRL